MRTEKKQRINKTPTDNCISVHFLCIDFNINMTLCLFSATLEKQGKSQLHDNI